MVALVLSFLLNSPAWAAADIQFYGLKWKADDSIELALLSDKKVVLLKGQAKEGESLAFSESGLEITITLHSNSFVSLTLAHEGGEMGTLVILERQNARYVPLSPVIPGPTVSLRAEFIQSLVELEKRKNWDHSLALRAMLSYFAVNKGQTMGQFRMAVEADQISLVAKPYADVQDRFKVKRLTTTSDTTAKPAAEKPKRKVNREPQPYEPRFEGYRPPRPPRQDRSRWQPWGNWFAPRSY